MGRIVSLHGHLYPAFLSRPLSIRPETFIKFELHRSSSSCRLNTRRSSRLHSKVVRITAQFSVGEKGDSVIAEPATLAKPSTQSRTRKGRDCDKRESDFHHGKSNAQVAQTIVGPLSESSGTVKGQNSISDPIDSAKAPGPTPLPIIGNALDMAGNALNDVMLKYANQYGSVVQFRVLREVLFLVTNPEAIAWVNQGNARNYLDRWTPPGFEGLLYNGKLRGLVFSKGRYWMAHRKVGGKGLRGSAFLDNLVDKAVDRTLFMLDKQWANKVGSAVNIHQEMRMLTLDVIGLGAFSKDFGAMTSGGRHEIEQRLSRVLHSILDIAKNPFPLWRYVGTTGRRAVENDVQRLGEIESEIIAERRAAIKAGTATQTPDFLNLLLKASESRNAPLFTDEDLRWDVHDVIFAGHETTASALAASLFLIAGDSRVQKKIAKELEVVLPNGRRPYYQDLEKLTYLGMVFNEALRLYPPTALLGRIAKKDDVIQGYRIPAGSSVLMSPYVMGRLEEYWDSPEEFRPERFSSESSAGRHSMTHTPFGAGPRVCLGAHMATTEAKVILVMILQRHNLERTSNRLEVEYDSTISFNSGMDMIIRRGS